MTHDGPYAQFKDRQLTLNDRLAIDRTVLANERTLLAYARTGLAMGVIGGTAIKFFTPAWATAIGVPFLLGAVAVAGVGARRYARLARHLRFQSA